MATSDQLPNDIIAVAKLLGLLDADGNFQPAWFENPLGEAGLKGMTHRVGDWIAVIQAAMGSPVACPAVPGVAWLQDAQAFSIANPLDGTPTHFYVVTPASSATSGTFGLGVLHTSRLEDLVITVYALAPLFDLSATGSPAFVLDSQPLQVGVQVTHSASATGETGGGTFSGANSVTFTGVTLDAAITLASGTAPTCTLSFDGIQNNGTTPGSYSSLATLIDAANGYANLETVAGWLADVLLQGTSWMHTYIGASVYTVGDLLVAAEFLQVDTGGGYALNTPYLIANVAHPTLLAENFLLNLLKLLASTSDASTPLIPISIGGAGSGIFVTAESAGTGQPVNYGLRLMIQDIVLGPKPTTADAKPQFTLQLGKWLAQETATDSWVARSEHLTENQPQPGVAFYLLSDNNPGQDPPAVSFNPYIELVSVGIDVAGTSSQPLVNLHGYVLSGAGLRVYLAQNSTDHESFTFGGAVILDGLGLPLGPGFVTHGGGSNPVPGQLLASAPASASTSKGTGEAGSSAGKDAVNPSFSLSAAYVEGFDLAFQLYDQDGKPTDLVKLPIDRAFGPLQCQTLGIGWTPATQEISLLFDGAVSLGGLNVDLIDLTVGVPVTAPTDFHAYSLDLQGLDVSFQNSAVSLTGGLLKTTVPVGTGGEQIVEYNGQAFLRFKQLALGALGSYGTLPGGGTSLFVFAFLSDPIGGPPAFYVTGLAAGFGYNRSLLAPPRDQVMSFPLVAGVASPAALGITSGQPPDLGSVLTSLQQFVPPTRGEDWLAAGVQFTSFDIVNSNALVIVEFGQTFEILILGLSILKLPQAGSTYAYVELGIEVTIQPDLGEIAATAIIGSGSYVIDPACHLTGGFAFYVWFGDNPHAGDFVLTIGGYNSAFTVPAWYPTVPRLAFNWPVSSDVTIKGDAYFALTPSCVMAGGGLQVLFSSGNLQAWFTATADFLITWKPFHYNATVGVSIGVSYHVHFLFIDTTIRVEIGATVDLWGPPTGGQARVHLWIVSFTVDFGQQPSATSTLLDWAEFQTMLPAAASGSTGELTLNTILPVAGLLQTLDGGTGATHGEGTWIVRPGTFAFSVGSTVPATSVTLNGHDVTPTLPTGYFVGIRPMGLDSIGSDLAVTITGDKDAIWTCEIAQRGVPEALWGAALPPGAQPAPAATVLPDRVVGFAKVTTITLAPPGPPAIDMAQAFTDVIVANAPLPLAQAATARGTVPDRNPTGGSLMDIAQIMDTGVAANRAALFAALGLLQVDAGTDGSLATLAADPSAAFTDSPMIGSPTAA